MDGQKKPRAREKHIIGESKGVEIHGEGLGTGPVGNTGGYEARKEQEAAREQQAQAKRESTPFGGQRPQQANSSGQHSQSGPASQQRPVQSPFGQSRPQQSPGAGIPFGQSRPQSGSGSSQKQYHSGVKQNSTGGGQRTGGTGGQRAGGGGGGKLLLIIIALVVLFGGGKISGLFGGDDSGLTNTVQQVISSGGGTSQSSSSGGSVVSDILGGESGSSGGLGNLLSSFLGSSGSSVYDTSGIGSLLSGLTGGGSSGNILSGGSSSESGASDVSQYFTSASTSSGNSSSLDESVSNKARSKYTDILGNKKDTVTILVYMCGTDLESQQGMATSDLKEMLSATMNDKINLLVYTGGCRSWRNNVISSKVNQIYQIKDGALYCLEKDMGTASMTNPETLVSFIQYGKKNFDANRMCLIFWDHGGGSVSGFGYDEKYGHNQSMTLAGINSALKKADVKFDFIGFDACLMATVENGIMLSQYADYMIASEETEPGVGWYYTNWLTALGKDTSLPTIRIGKQIADDFVEVCNQKCRGQATTLSVVDLAELQATIPDELKQFSIDTNELIQNNEYKTVSKARSKTREFAQQSKIDQIDLAHFAGNLGTKEGKSLAKALKGAVKYNRTGGGISNAYGLSIYFPYKRANKVSQMVSTYEAIGMDEEYTRCIQEFASLEVSGQVSAGTPVANYGTQGFANGGLFESLTGQGGGYTTSYSVGGLQELLGGMYGGSGNGGSTGSILDLFMGRSMTAEKAASYILENHFDAGSLVWQNGRIELPDDQWSLINSLALNVFYDNGSGYIDLGMDNTYETDGNALIGSYDGTWICINRQPVAYYYLDTVEEDDNYVISGYVPAILNGERVKLILQFDSERPQGYIAGAQKVYTDGESDTEAKALISIGKGDTLQFICDFYDYDRNFRDAYKLGKEMTLGDTVEIGNGYVDKEGSKCLATYCFTDIYQKQYWTPVIGK